MSHELRIQNCVSRLNALRDSAATIGLYCLIGSLFVLTEKPEIQTEDLVEALERATVEAEEKAKREVES